MSFFALGFRPKENPFISQSIAFGTEPDPRVTSPQELTLVSWSVVANASLNRILVFFVTVKKSRGSNTRVVTVDLGRLEPSNIADA